ncbi:hypothetical protein BT63DRAFT_479423 [Microthyrium microscopicum]|uniref:T6SS Phospholipase effector Tle1-like catalytic domain-containing protein n=1 Tax=Microthyrium microscopicum TaxID=703497 RepID=A0A6A6UCN2_9PEZI|nr:hypothetical protein BT63DRAFT_479423 [Microthyrium microscopicum]
MATEYGENFPIINNPPHHRRKFVLCFDGTGNKFSGTDVDSNILKIYRMLDRTDHTQFHYYQPGIGTYVTGHSLSHSGKFARFKSWYLKTKDSAMGTSLDQHVMGGYKFLMRYYRPDDEIFLFGFSRGAYTARFLAEMIDHIGLLSQGNEELIRFAWKTFQKWQTRTGESEKDSGKKKYLLDFMCAFRETFSRPVRPIQFLGLFDTVNSVPRFENALMSRTKFPYTARTTARYIRHAVSISERRAKFRQDLIGEKPKGQNPRTQAVVQRYRARPSIDEGVTGIERADRGRQPTLHVPERYRDGSEISGLRALSPGYDPRRSRSASRGRRETLAAVQANQAAQVEAEAKEEKEQDIQEVWFLGDHADIGGGWTLEGEDEVALSHVPLVWMTREAQRAGLHFDPVKLRALHCAPEEHDAGIICNTAKAYQAVPQIIEPNPSDEDLAPNEKPAHEIIPEAPNSTNDKSEDSQHDGIIVDDLPEFHRKLHLATTKGKIHDTLCFGNIGISASSVIAWNFMEYLPFRRMDLQDDGSWKPIVWPLPKGEVRDIPDDVVVHNSVIKRMRYDEKCRPGNLILGGGGRGIRIAPKEFGTGEWKVLREEGDFVGEVWVRVGKPVGSRQNSGMNGIKRALTEKKNGIIHNH